MKTKYFLFLRFGLFSLIGALFFYAGRTSFKYDLQEKKAHWLLAIQEAHRFSDIPIEKRKLEIKKDRVIREVVMEEFNRSLKRYSDTVSDKLLDEFVNMAMHAKVLSIYEADTMGMCMRPDAPLSVLPLGSGEYLVYNGVRKNSVGYYDPNCNMIVLRLDKPIMEVNSFSLGHARLYIHELGHAYLQQKGIEDIEVAHDWIAHVQSRFSAELAKVNPNMEDLFGKDVHCELPPKSAEDVPEKKAPQHTLVALHEEQLVLRFA